MIIFLLKASLVITVLLIFYKVFLEKESFFALNRIYLLGCLVFTFALPFISLPELVSIQGFFSTQIERIHDQTSLTSLDMPADQASTPTQRYVSEPQQNQTTTPYPSEKKPVTEVAYWLFVIYCFGVIVFFLHLITQVLGILWKALNSRDKIADTGYIIINTSQIKEPCSFFGYIFINPESYDLDTYEQIIAHEKIHAKNLHSVDLLISEIAIIALWFNPLVWVLRKEIEKNLEYQTDNLLLASKTVEKRVYQMSLLRITTFYKPLTVTTNYNQSLLKQRIKKMNAKKSNPHSYWKYAFIAPILLVTLIIMNKPVSALAQHAEEESLPAVAQGDTQDCRELLSAVKANDQSKVAELIKTITPNCTYYGDDEPRSPLVAAARNGALEIGQLLVEAQADIEFHAAGDETPLMAAARYGQLEFVKYLVDQGAEINRQLGGDGTALINACQNGHLEVAKYLISQKAEINQAVQGDGTPLLVAAKNGHLEVVKYLLSQNAKINQSISGDGTALIAASKNGQLDVVRYLISQKAEIDQQVPGDGTALIDAVKNNHYTTAKLLLENGADPYLHAPGDEYAMFHARIAKNKEMIALLNQYAKEE
uniref:Ankyrin repeat domain-containing protein n=1 Tax=Roseihalotalea indica TaxID=2867963 RepID=A0AA49GJ20_9BACT|nr:ankyrin repeat domain-containing protein [Tunicatimonas sp. TK19036]